MKYYTVYETVNKETGKCYRGCHVTKNPYDGYLGSGKYLKRAINKYGIEKFEKFVLYVFDNKEDMVKKEIELVDDEYLRTANTYNLKKGGEGGWDYLIDLPKMKEVRRKNIEYGVNILREKLKDDNFRMKWSKRSSDTLKKTNSEGKIRYDTFTGKCHSKETKDKIGIANSIHQQGDKNSHYGTCWIYSDIEKKSISIKKDDLQLWLDKGWTKGRKMKF